MLANLITVSNFNANLLRKMLASVDDSQMCEQPPALPNHPAWILGHLSFVRSVILKQLGVADGGAFPEAWAGLFGRGSTPQNDRSAYPAKVDLLAAYDRLQDAVIGAVKSLSPERLAAPHTIETMKSAFPTLGDLLLQMLTGHDGLHAGQLSDWRRAMGMGRIM